MSTSNVIPESALRWMSSFRAANAFRKMGLFSSAMLPDPMRMQYAGFTEKEPIVTIFAHGKGFANVVNKVQNAPYRVVTFCTDTDPSYPLVGAAIVGTHYGLAFVLDPFTTNGQTLVRRWVEEKSLTVVMCQQGKVLSKFDAACNDDVTRTVALARPAEYDDGEAAPTRELARVYADLTESLENQHLLLVAAVDETTTYAAKARAQPASRRSHRV